MSIRVYQNEDTEHLVECCRQLLLDNNINYFPTINPGSTITLLSTFRHEIKLQRHEHLSNLYRFLYKPIDADCKTQYSSWFGFYND